MTKNEAKKLIEYVFTNKFEESFFEKFVSNIFKEYKPLSSVREGQSIKDAFKPQIAKYKVMGSFSDAEGNDVDILLVALNNINTLQRSRTLQRNFVADYLNTNNKEAAIVAFVTNKDEWRFSLVKLDHSLQVIEDKLKTKKEVTPARRWSFLVGKNEGSHTAQSRFIKLLTSDEKPNLSELESAFNIESVTKEFFDRYTELFFSLEEHLQKLINSDESIKEDFAGKEIPTADFAKKTLGQIVFLYFLQKKGWFGVASDKDWGSGPKNFLREVFNRREKYGKNFFNDILEPLFYEGLAQDRGEKAIYTRLNNVRMPFLNGGLFEPMNDYQWETTDIIIPDELFSNDVTDTKTGDVGTGILDVFDRYNFTVNENEPLEQEVAVDPEMLGKVFENLLEIKDRKSRGAFYTPREIVHYMCQETLVNYLEAETENIDKSDIEFFIRQGELILENDKTTANKIAEKEDRGYEYKGVYSYILPQSIIDNAKDIDKLLYNIKVADPAVGSGAFPLGMLNEIVRARRVIGVHTKDNKKVYTLKKETISNS
ncbi:class I SAM-dependent DNA methyltransferase, partial [Patescibacteria group bacterium]|nr:class I SAM-dependent DNA methyltransferase [Patescibacteria group bacterium]